jgi:hypothetical protein
MARTLLTTSQNVGICPAFAKRRVGSEMPASARTGHPLLVIVVLSALCWATLITATLAVYSALSLLLDELRRLGGASIKEWHIAQRHVAPKHIDELREALDTDVVDNPTHTRHLLGKLSRSLHLSPKTEHSKKTAISADTFSLFQDPPGAVQLDRKRNDEHERQGKKQ